MTNISFLVSSICCKGGETKTNKKKTITKLQKLNFERKYKLKMNTFFFLFFKFKKKQIIIIVYLNSLFDIRPYGSSVV